eukprot:Platyproteum_vivax@DN3744_c0_g1_i1.p1
MQTSSSKASGISLRRQRVATQSDSEFCAKIYAARKSKLEEYLSLSESMYFGFTSNSSVNDNFCAILERMYPSDKSSSKSNNKQDGSSPSHLDLLVHRSRFEEVFDLWGPWEIAVFEAAICKYGKTFHKISKLLPNKTTKDCVNFYYIWKKTNRYIAWKANRGINPHLADE